MSNTLGTKRLGTVLALIVAFAIALAMIVTPAARAAETEGQATHKVGNIKTDQTGSIIVHKYSAPTIGAEHHDGSALSGSALPDASKKLKDVEFTIYDINGIDLKTAAGWDTLKKLKDSGTIADDGSAVTIPSVPTVSKGNAHGQMQKTNAEGEATFSNLPVGAYLVVETDYTKAKNPKGEPVTVTAGVKPFVVTVPFPTSKAIAGNDTGWLYNVNVYPKNEITNKPSKKLVVNNSKKQESDTAVTGVNATRLTKGGQLEWEITVPIPALNKKFEKFVITDTLESGTVRATKAPIVKIGDTADTASVVLEENYDVSAADLAAVTITFKGADKGFKLLNDNKGKKVFVNLYVTVKEGLANHEHKVVNKDYKLTYKVEGGDDHDVTPPPPGTNPPTAYFGDFNLHKVSAVPNDNSVSLKGAVFSVFKTQADATAGTDALIENLTSGEDGIVHIEDLFRGDTADSQRTYWVKETTAPAGFILPADPVEITVSDTTGSGTTGNKNIENTPHGPGDVPPLPLTGASGKLMMTLGGAAIVLFAAGTVLVTRRRKA